jgi:hypothetical protein
VINGVQITKDGYQYPEAGENAPDLIQQAIQRFHEEVPDDRKEDTPLLYWLLGDGTPSYKMSKPDSDYAEEPKGEQKCGNCEYAYQEVVTGKLICSKVRGEIKLEHWCRLWEGEDEP